MLSGRDDSEGDDLRAVRRRTAQRRADRRAARQRTEIQGELAVGSNGDRLPVD
jgi:hypothetical protein